MSDGKVLFTAGEDKKLVELISKFPCIYDVSLPVYKDQTVKDNAWREIEEFVERSVEDCKKRWRNIKDTFQKRQKKGKSTASSKGKKWPLADMLEFLSKVDHKRKSISNVQGEETQTQYEDGEESSRDRTQTPPTSSETDISQNVEVIQSFRPPRKRERQDKILELINSRQTEREAFFKKLSEEKRDDDIDLFFKSIASSVKKLSPNLINEAKMRSLQMLIDLENRNTFASNFPLCPSSPRINN